MDNGGGYSSIDEIIFKFEDTPEAVLYSGIRDSFDNVGNLIAGTACSVDDLIQGVEICDEEGFVPTSPIGSSIVDSPYYFQQEDFDSLVAIQDATRWTVEGLPFEINSIAVVLADSSIELSEREVLCRGFRSVSDEIRMFCTATDEQLASSTEVLGEVDGTLGGVIPTAKLVPIQ